LTNEVEDIFAMLLFLDERGQLPNLPRYVSSGPDNMPSVRLFDGDMRFLLARLDKLEEKLSEFSSSLVAITADIQQIRQHSKGPQVLSTHSLAGLPQANPQSCSMGGSSTMYQPEAVATGNSHESSLTNSVNIGQLIPSTSSSWAAVAASTPLVNKTVHLVRDDQLSSESADEGYTKVHSRKKRRRQSPQEQEQEQVAAGDQSINPTKSTHPRRKPLLVGKLENITASSTTYAITAAKPLIKKAVFYVDNVDKSVSIDDMHAFVSELGVDVLSLFETKPRQRRNVTYVERKAFRLCINNDHRDRLLVDSKWPIYVSISEWFFKQKNQPNVIQYGSTSSDVIHTDTASNHFMGAAFASNDTADATIIMCDHSQDSNELPSTLNSNGVTD
jgi:hypothetical protein